MVLEFKKCTNTECNQTTKQLYISRGKKAFEPRLPM